MLLTSLSTSAENVLYKLNSTLFYQNFSNLEVKNVYLNQTSVNVNDFGISSEMNLALNLVGEDSTTEYYQIIINSSSLSYAGFYDPNLINALIKNGKLQKNYIYIHTQLVCIVLCIC